MKGEEDFRLLRLRLFSPERINVRLRDPGVAPGERHRHQAAFVMIVPGCEVHPAIPGRVSGQKVIVQLVEAEKRLIEIVARHPAAVVTGPHRRHPLHAALLRKPPQPGHAFTARHPVQSGLGKAVGHVENTAIGGELLKIDGLEIKAEITDEKDIMPGSL
ncbi:hypothetical protein SDC9_155174 [bioreactor metagenome]|uniref:Uncharacterized protein n=1 Tax=bioreactor metagenome TaxID=1076179 RepID=A0A645F306_9ZZZZ